MAVTSKDVAERAGVSQSLVSMYINRSRAGRMSSVTREKIEKAIRELDYRPNLAARALCSGKTRTIGVVTGGIIQRSYELHLLMNELKERGYKLIISLSNFNQSEEREAFAEMLNRQVDSIIYLGNLDSGSKLFGQLHKSHAPVLLTQPADGLLNSLSCDRSAAFREGLAEFKRRGHRKVFYISYLYAGHQFSEFAAIAKELELEVESFAFPLRRQNQEEVLEALFCKAPRAVFSVIGNGVLVNRINRYFKERGSDFVVEAIHGYRRPFDEICTEHMLGYVHVPFLEYMERVAARAVEIAEHPGGICCATTFPARFLRPDELPELRRRELALPEYDAMQNMD